MEWQFEGEIKVVGILKTLGVPYDTKYNAWIRFFSGRVYRPAPGAPTPVCTPRLCEDVTATKTFFKRSLSYRDAGPKFQVIGYLLLKNNVLTCPLSFLLSLSLFFPSCLPPSFPLPPPPFFFFKSGNRIKSNPWNRRKPGITQLEKGMRMCFQGNKIKKIKAVS